jgi:hypothetical protein
MKYIGQKWVLLKSPIACVKPDQAMIANVRETGKEGERRNLL